MSYLYDTTKSAIAELEEWLNEQLEDYGPVEPEPHDRIFEIADSYVPVYTADLLKLALDNLELASAEPELGPAFDGRNTPVNLIASNVFEYIEEQLWEWWNENAEDRIAELAEE